MQNFKTPGTILPLHVIYVGSPVINVTVSGKISLIANLKVLRNSGFKYLVCCGLLIVKLSIPNFYTFYTNSLPFRTLTVHVANS